MNNIISIPTAEQMTKRGSTPEYIKETIEYIKLILTKDKEIYNILVENNLALEQDYKGNNPLEVRYHGSYARHTDTFHFNKIEKSDIDIYVKVADYFSSPSVFKNRNGRDKNFVFFVNQWTPGVFNNFYISKDDGSPGYREIRHFVNFKNDLAKYLINKLRDCEVTNSNKVIKLKKGTLTVEIAICGSFKLDLNNNAKSLPWFKEINNYLNDKKINLENYIKMENHFFSVKGINIITSKYEEIQNFPEINNLNITIKNSKTNGLFSKYARYLKNLIKMINQNDLIIILKSYHLECLLYYMPDFLFKDWNSKETLKQSLLNCLKYIGFSDESDFKSLKEINGILRLSRNLEYKNYRNSIDTLIDWIKKENLLP